MSSVVLGIAGGAVGSYFGGPAGARIGFLVGSTLGSYIDQKKQRFEGPRLSDRRYMTSVYGAMIPICRGTIGVTGNVIWAADLQEESHTEESGGKGGPTTSTTLYSYFANFAVSLCEGPISSINRIWANGRLWFDANASSQGYTQWTLYPGSETQMPDPTIESFKGVGNVPAYRGQAYIVFDHMPVEQFGNRIPQLQIEVVEDSSISHAIETINSHPYVIAQDSAECIFGSDGRLWGTNLNSNNEPIREINPTTGAVLSAWDPPAPLSYSLTCPISGGRFYGLTDTPADNFARIAIVNPSAQTSQLVNNQANTGEELGYPAMMCPLGDDLLMIQRLPDAGNTAIAKRVSISTGRVSVTGTDVGTAAMRWLSLINPPDIGYGATDGTFYYALSEFDTITNKYTIFRFNASTMTLVSSHLAPVIGNAGNCLYYQGKLYVGTTANQLDRWDVATMTYEGSLAVIGRWVAVSEDPRYLLTTSSSATGGTIVTASTFTVHSTIGSALPAGGIGVYRRDAIDRRMLQVDVSGGTYKLLRVRINLVGSNPIPLSSIVADYCGRVGLEASELNVSALASIPVRGLMVARQCNARQAIEPLIGAYFFDGVESGGQLKFIRRGGTASIAIPDADLLPRG